MSETAIFLLTICLGLLLVVLIFAIVTLSILIYIHFKMRSLREDVDVILNSAMNTEEYMGQAAANEQFLSAQN